MHKNPDFVPSSMHTCTCNVFLFESMIRLDLTMQGCFAAMFG